MTLHPLLHRRRYGVVLIRIGDVEDAVGGDGVGLVAPPVRVGDDLEDGGRVAGQGAVGDVGPVRRAAAAREGHVDVATGRAGIVEGVVGAGRIAGLGSAIGQSLRVAAVEARRRPRRDGRPGDVPGWTWRRPDRSAEPIRRSWSATGLTANWPNGVPALPVSGPTFGHCGSGFGPPGDCRPLVWPRPLTLKKLGIAPPQQGFWYWKTVPEPVGSVATDPPTVARDCSLEAARTGVVVSHSRLPLVSRSGAE